MTWSVLLKENKEQGPKKESGRLRRDKNVITHKIKGFNLYNDINNHIYTSKLVNYKHL